MTDSSFLQGEIEDPAAQRGFTVVNGQDLDQDDQNQDDELLDVSDEDDQQGNTSTVPIPKQDISVLQSPVPFIVEMRQTLFNITHPIDLKDEEFERYWPYVDNVWVRQHKGTAKTSSSVDYYSCRLQRATYNRKADPRPDGPVPRKKRTRAGGTCQARMKISRQDGPVPWFRLQRLNDNQHSHDLEYIDRLKRNTVVMDIARSEVMKGYMPASVFTILHQDPAKLASIGGQFITRNDVRNYSAAWRSTFKGELGVHPGYRYDIGNGISVIRDPRTVLPTGSLAHNLILPSTVASQASLPPDTLFFPPQMSSFMANYLPIAHPPRDETTLPFVTLTYATSLDSCISLGRTIPTPISGPTSKAMTHHLRAHHDAILVGVGTAIADNPSLNCRIAGAGGYGGLGWSSQPRPIIIDPSARWDITHDSKILATTRAGKGHAPWIIVAEGTQPGTDKVNLIQKHGGKFLGLSANAYNNHYRFDWEAILQSLAHTEGIRSIMIEGGASIINDLLRPENLRFIDSIIITIAPTYLGAGSISIGAPARRVNPSSIPIPLSSPTDLGPNPTTITNDMATDTLTNSSSHTLIAPTPGQIPFGNPQRSNNNGAVSIPSVRFADVKWQQLGEDVVMCGRIRPVTMDMNMHVNDSLIGDVDGGGIGIGLGGLDGTAGGGGANGLQG